MTTKYITLSLNFSNLNLLTFCTSDKTYKSNQMEDTEKLGHYFKDFKSAIQYLLVTKRIYPKCNPPAK